MDSVKKFMQELMQNFPCLRMTFSHQLDQPDFRIEQLYRAYTIMKGEPYHQ
jgi:23S rRNA pseudoU1915 N3-methylase RlmH